MATLRRTADVLAVLAACAGGCVAPPGAPDAPSVRLPERGHPQPGRLVAATPSRTVAPMRPTGPTAPDEPLPPVRAHPEERRAPAPGVAEPGSPGATKPESPDAAELAYRRVLERSVPTSSGGIAVRVCDADGVPLPRVSVRVMNLLWAWEGPGVLPFTPSDVSSAESDVDGAVRFPRVGTRAVFVYAADGDTVACRVSGSRGHYRRPDDVELRLGPGVPFAGRVVDADGAPVPGASVQIDLITHDKHFLDISRPDGAFGGGLVPAHFAVDGVRLRVGAEGYELVEQRLDASAFRAGVTTVVTLPR